MAELRLTFSPHDIIGAPTVKKVTITQAKRVIFKIDGRARTLEHRYNNLLNGHSYRFGDSVDYIESASREGDIITAHYRLYAGATQSVVYTDFSTTPIFHYVASGETAALDGIGNDVVEVVPAQDNELFAKNMKPRLTFAAHHFIRNLPPASAPRILSRHHDIMRSMANISAVEATENNRYDNVVNYYRSILGFLWRECERHINRAKSTPTGPEPVKTIAQFEDILTKLEATLMGQSGHAEHGSHAGGAHRSDPHVYRFYAEHDEPTWTTKIETNSQIWLADEGSEPSELVYDIKAQHTNDAGVVNTGALSSEVASLFITNFREAYLASPDGLGFHDRSIYIP